MSASAELRRMIAIAKEGKDWQEVDRYLARNAETIATLLDVAQDAVDDGYDRGKMIAALKPFTKE